MRRKRLPGFVVTSLLAVAGCQPTPTPESEPAPTPDRVVPQFEVDPSWPTLPDDWVLGPVTSVTADARDHVWVLHRPRSVPDDQQANAAPPVLEFDNAGTFVSAWGGPGEGYEWPTTEHGIHVDPRGNVWVSGNNGEPESDDMLLKFTTAGCGISDLAGHIV